MKYLYILRHAKSSWDDPALSDFERPLNERGRNAAPFMGEVIAKRGYLPDVVISSPAKRAMATTTLIKESAGFNAEVKFDDRIYEASPSTLRQVVSEIDDASESAMVVGHNPGIEGFIRFLTGRLEPMPTTALALIKLNVDSWNDIGANLGEIVEVIRPKEEMKSLGAA